METMENLKKCARVSHLNWCRNSSINTTDIPFEEGAEIMIEHVFCPWLLRINFTSSRCTGDKKNHWTKMIDSPDWPRSNLLGGHFLKGCLVRLMALMTVTTPMMTVMTVMTMVKLMRIIINVVDPHDGDDSGDTGHDYDRDELVMMTRIGVQTCRINLCVSCTAFCNGTIRHQEEKRKKKHKDEQDSKRNKRNTRKKRNKSKVSHRFDTTWIICGSQKGGTPAHTFGMEMHSPTYKYKVIQVRPYCKPENVVIRCQWMWLSQGVERIQKPLVVSATYKSYDQKTPLIALDCFVLWNASQNWGPDL